MRLYPWSKKAPASITEKCWIVALVDHSEGLILDIAYEDGHRDEREIARYELPSAKETVVKCGRCGEPIRLGEQVARVGQGEVMIQAVLFILPSDVLRLSPAREDWRRETWSPRNDPVIHAAHAIPADMERIKAAKDKWDKAMVEYYAASAAFEGRQGVAGK